ncbi:MAG: lytic transglycosylase domain-containing protein [Rhodobacterales bacterium]|nr:lytic transglycosylase domain-containing protein [Rhodobacterales bacterium]
MPALSRRAVLALMLAMPALSACGDGRDDPEVGRAAPAEAGSPAIRARVDRWADHYDVPRDLVHRVVRRESNYNPAARNGPYWGLMQIHPRTAQTMGFRGQPRDLLDADTNLKYAVKYLRGAWLVARGDKDEAVRWYARGYYYEAKRLGLLEETGLRG